MVLKRSCYICGDEITNCMGYVLIGDFMKYMDKQQDYVREICGRDIIKADVLGINFADIIDDQEKLRELF